MKTEQTQPKASATAQAAQDNARLAKVIYGEDSTEYRSMGNASKGESAHMPLGGLNIDVTKSKRWPSYNWQDYQAAIVRQNHHISKVEARRDELLMALKEVDLRCTQARIASEIGKQKNKVEFLLGELERIRNVAKAEGSAQ